MFADVTSLTVNPMFLRHDLLIALGRLEAAIGDLRSQGAANEQGDLAALESRQAALRQTLTRLSA
jgi:hypothetical protein